MLSEGAIMQKSGKFKRFLRVFLTLIIIAAVGAGGFMGFQAWNSNRRIAAMAAERANSVSIQRAIVQDVSEIVSASGVVKLNNEESVFAATAERVAEVKVEVGDKVKEGQIILLYDIDTKRKQLEKQIQQTEINLSNQNLTLQSMTVPASSSSLRQLQSSLDSANKSLYDAKSNVTNTENKISDQQDTIAQSRETYENSQDSINKADRDIQSAQDALAKAKQKETDAETELANQKQLLEVDGISESEYQNFVNAVDTAKDGVTQAQNSLDNANDAKKQALNSQKQASYSITNAENSLRDLRNTLESNKMNVTSAQQNVTTAQGNLSDANVVLKEETDKINYEKQKNQIKLTELDLEDYRQQLADLTESAVSPLDGTITSINVAQGKSVDTSTVLLTIANFNDLIVTSNISEYDIPKLQIGQPVVMTSDGMDNVRYTGMVSKISDSASTQNASSGTETVVPVEITFNEPVTDLKPGFNLELEVTVANNPKAITVPITALQKDEYTGGYSVFVIGDDRIIKKMPVTKGITNDMVVEITTGISEGDSVVTNPTADMRDGESLDEMGVSRIGRPTNANGFNMFGGNGARPNVNMGSNSVRVNTSGGNVRQQAPQQRGGN